jgi:hypothetical protein
LSLISLILRRLSGVVDARHAPGLMIRSGLDLKDKTRQLERALV